MQYLEFFPDDYDKKKYTNRKLGFLVLNCTYAVYNNTIYVDDFIPWIPSEINGRHLSHYYYAAMNNKSFILPKVTASNPDEAVKVYDSAILNTKSFTNFTDELYLDYKNLECINNHIQYYNKDIRKLYFNNLYISTTKAYIAALALLLNFCDNIYFVNDQFTHNPAELIEWCDFFKLDYSYENDDTFIKVDTKNREVMNSAFDNFSYPNHIKKVLDNKITYSETLTQFLIEEFDES